MSYRHEIKGFYFLRDTTTTEMSKIVEFANKANEMNRGYAKVLTVFDHGIQVHFVANDQDGLNRFNTVTKDFFGALQSFEWSKDLGIGGEIDHNDYLLHQYGKCAPKAKR